MKIFPTKELRFNLINDQDESINRLKRRTEKSQALTSQFTDKSFRGFINGYEFKLISSTIGLGAFCVMTGSIETSRGIVKVEINKAFRVLSSILMFLPLIAIIFTVINQEDTFSPILILVGVFQILIIRFGFIGMAFKFLSRESLNRLRDVLDLEWDEN